MSENSSIIAIYTTMYNTVYSVAPSEDMHKQSHSPIIYINFQNGYLCRSSAKLH